MEEFINGKIVPVNVEREMKDSYIEYAMSVIVGRALPDVRDGLKPVHRRVLYSMYEQGVTPDKPHKKSARVVGDVLGKYHPHGDTAVYDTIVRLAQDFSLRMPLVDGHGNFGSVDGDSAAAMRYTEVRMQKIALEMMTDLNKDTVDFMPNYDGDDQEPTVLPARFPNLLVNGSSGIAVGMATNIPPHNLGEVIDGVVALIDNPDIDIKGLRQYIKGPDFPTAGIILGTDGIASAYETGRGAIRVRARSVIEQMSNGKQRIVVTELPYQVNKARLIERIAELVRDKKIDGITDLRDESDREGMRVVIELRRDVNGNVILNQLYKHTQMQETFGAIMLALVDGVPRVLNLKQILTHYIKHQEDVIVRRSRFDLAKAEARAHIVEGLKIALDFIDEVVATIRSAASTAEAKEKLMARFGLSEKQTQAILEMRLRALTGLEREKLEDEYRELIKTIAYLQEVLSNEQLVLSIIKEEITAIKDKFGDERRTVITYDEGDLSVEDLIADEDVVITITNNGYIKRIPVGTYRQQKRGGRGVTAMSTKQEDFVDKLFITTTHNYLMFFTDKGKCFRLKVHEIPEAGRTAKGTALVNLLNLTGEDEVTAVIPVKQFTDEYYLFMATAQGTVKKSLLTDYDSSRRDGLQAIKLDDGDRLIGVKLTKGDEEIILSTADGAAIRFSEEDVRPMGRVTRGVRGIRLADDDYVVSMDTVQEGGELLVVSERGYGKRTPVADFRQTGRGGKGVFALRCNEKTGKLAAIEVVRPGDEMMIMSREGIIIRINVDDISQQGRYAHGVTLIRLGEGDAVIDMAKVIGGKDDPTGTDDETGERLNQEELPLQ
ncbi:MAG: DNA gyrase subunit A [Peptococcaceae bacterium]|jgi:DNA gyrase subunit A|nr:DNA gyrase subunit A [Peptococcaceae bacterium]